MAAANNMITVCVACMIGISGNAEIIRQRKSEESHPGGKGDTNPVSQKDYDE